jgi:hypothetical protein
MGTDKVSAAIVEFDTILPSPSKLMLILASILIFSSIANASPENDRVYQLETVGWLKASDNSDGIFADYMDDQYAHYFSGQTRFVPKLLKGLNSVLDQSSTQYPELVQQADILKKIALKYKVESLLRTRVYKENDSYRFVIEWVYAPKGDVLASVEFRFVDAGNEEGFKKSELPRAISAHLDELIQKLPFLGQVTGIEGDTITVSVGHNQNVKPKDILTLYTIQNVKRHPILKTIEEWRWQEVGRAKVEQVEESLSFAKVISLEPNQNVIRFQKVREILPAPPEKTADAAPKKEIPRLGWVAGNAGIGSYSRDVGLPNGASGRTGGGLLEAFQIDTQVWLNSRFITQATLGATSFKYSPKDLASGNAIGSNYSGSGSDFRLAVGYSFFPMNTVFDSIAWAVVGYKSTSYSISTQTTDYVGDSSFGSLFIGIGGQVAFDENFSGELGIDLGVLKSASSADFGFGDASASTDLSFRIAGIYHLDSQWFLRLQIRLNSESMDFAGGQSISEKNFSVSPSIMYYF